MKKKIFFAIAFSALLVSCDKQYNCVCTNPGGSYIAFDSKGSKSLVQHECAEYYEKNFGNVPMNETYCEVREK